ncbi:hypothetical protein IWQ56_001721 [Coemansia nantahalensis]|nr:hypothetical protein IWQ56_001721 [Coemansia nantahalensis]
MKLFDGFCAWFAPNVPASHVTTWVADGGVQVRDANSSAIRYFFSNALDDDQTLELVRTNSKVVYRSTWVTDSALSRTRQPLGSYALTQARRTPGTASSNSSGGGGGGMAARRMPHAVVSDRRATLARPASYYSPARAPALEYPAGSARRPLSEYGAPGDVPRFWDPVAASETQSIRSRCSSRLSNSSSVISGRRQHVVSRFVIHADAGTCQSILADVADFTPNANGFVAYKIPKLA